jgi:hypothetical protein
MPTTVAARFSAPSPLKAATVAAPLAALFLLGGSSTALSAQQAAPQRNAEAATSLTLYQDGRVLVRRAFPIKVPNGASTQRVPLGPIDPSSLFSLDSAVAYNGAVTTPALDPDGALRRAVGKTLVFRSGTGLRDTISATVLGLEPVRVRLADGTIFFGLPGQPTFPADLAAGEPVTELRLTARRAADQLRLGGFAQGGGWNTMYTIVLRGSSAQVTGLASFAAPFTAEDAEVQLLAGQVNQAPMRDMLMPQAARVTTMAASAEFGNAQKVAEQEGVGEFHLYTLPGRHRLSPGVLTSVALFEPASAPVTKSFEIRTSVSYSGYWGQVGDGTEVPVSVFYTLTRARRTPFGDAPLPGGAARIFQADSAGRLQLIGEAGTGHTAPGEELRIDAGVAFDIVAKRIQTDWQQGTEPVPNAPRRSRTFVVAAYADTVRNQSAAPVDVDLLVQRVGAWQVIESSLPIEKLTSTRSRFRVKVPAGGETVVTYRIKATW